MIYTDTIRNRPDMIRTTVRRLPAAHPSEAQSARASEGCQEERCALTHLRAGQHARSALTRSTGLWLRSACSGSVLVCRRGWWGRSSPASSGTACGPAPGGGRVYRALHSPCGPAAHIVLALALPWCESTPRACARCFTFPLLNLLGWLKAACGAAFSL